MTDPNFPKFKFYIDAAVEADIVASMGGLLDRFIGMLKDAPGCGDATTLIRSAAMVLINELAREAQRRTVALELRPEDQVVAICAMAEAMAATAGFQLNNMPLTMKIVANFKLGEAVKRGLTVPTGERNAH